MNIEIAEKLITGELTLRDLTKEELKEYYKITVPTKPIYERTCMCCEDCECGGGEIIGYTDQVVITLSEEQLNTLYEALHA